MEWSLPVSGPIVLMYTHGTPMAYDWALASWVTDHPAASADGGPASCGSCFPSDRVTRSFYYGNAETTYCPGVPLADDTCAAELVWYAAFSCASAVERSSWSGIKALFR